MFKIDLRLVDPEGGTHHDLPFPAGPESKLSALRAELGPLVFADAHFLRRSEKIPGRLEDEVSVGDCVYMNNGKPTIDVENHTLGGDAPSD